MLAKFSYLKKGRVGLIRELPECPGWEAMLCTDGGGEIYVRVQAVDLPALTSGLVELVTTDRKVWINPERVMSIVNLDGSYQLTLTNGRGFDVVDVSALLEAIK